MYPCAHVGKPSDIRSSSRYSSAVVDTNTTLTRCEYKRILAHEGSMTSRYKVPYTIQARYKQDTVEYRCIPDVATGYKQDTSKIQSNTYVCRVYAAWALANRWLVGGHGSSKSCVVFPLASPSDTQPEVNQTALKASTAILPLDSAVPLPRGTGASSTP